MNLGLFYRARINSVQGASGDGKSWAALAGIVERIQRDEVAALIDWEDNPDGIASRLLALGLTPRQIARVDYRNPATGIGSQWARSALAGMERRGPSIVVLDSVGEAMAASGVDGNADGEVAAWMARVKAISRWECRPAVVLVDHIPKDPDSRSPGAIGSQRKLAAVTGASYRSTQVVAFSRTKAGKLKLTVEKDRLGNRAKGSVAAMLHFTPMGDGKLSIEVRKSEAQEAADAGTKFRPTYLMERVSRWLELYPGSSGRDVAAGVSGKATGIRLALDALVEEGFVTVTPGARGASLHTVARPFHDDEILDRVPPRPTASRTRSLRLLTASPPGDPLRGGPGGRGQPARRGMRSTTPARPRRST